uniref:Uncharacterized protein n=1 Tax=Arundo donax TaxID=35708 RepID=A0A0A9BHT0_ARUDO
MSSIENYCKICFCRVGLGPKNLKFCQA